MSLMGVAPETFHDEDMMLAVVLGDFQLYFQLHFAIRVKTADRCFPQKPFTALGISSAELAEAAPALSLPSLTTF